MMEQLDEIFDAFEEKLHDKERTDRERQSLQEAEVKRAFEVGQANLRHLVIPAVEGLIAEMRDREHELGFVEINSGNRPMVAVTFRAKRNGALLSKATSSLVFESWGKSLYSPNSQILNSPSSSTPQYLKNSESHTQPDIRRAVVNFIKDVLKALQENLSA